MSGQPRTIVIPVFWIRILWTLPRTIFICDQILPPSLPALLKDFRWENWILKAHRELNPARSTSAATNQNRSGHVETGVHRREFLKVTAGAADSIVCSIG